MIYSLFEDIAKAKLKSYTYVIQSKVIKKKNIAVFVYILYIIDIQNIIKKIEQNAQLKPFHLVLIRELWKTEYSIFKKI